MRGFALLVVVGVLGGLSVLAAAFVTMAQMERRASEQRVHATQAFLLARSGIEDALARLAAGQQTGYGGRTGRPTALTLMTSPRRPSSPGFPTP